MHTWPDEWIQEDPVPDVAEATIKELEALLAKHAAFETYYQKWEEAHESEHHHLA